MAGFLFSKKSKAILSNIALLKVSVLYLLLFFFNATDSFSQSLTAEQIYKKVSGAVVVIHAYNSNNELAKQGSGVVINDKGFVVTNYHVLEGCERLEVVHNKEIVPYVDIIGIDVEKDILILKIDKKKFPSIKIGDVQKISIGQRVYAIGSPLGFENSISEGIISGLRSYEASGRSFIQITASISPGSSGGAVVNEKGELIGISTLTAKEGQNLNFAIPIDDVLAVKIDSYSKDKSYKNFELFSKGFTAQNKKDFQVAINYYTAYLIIYPNDAEAYTNRGVAKDDLEDYRGAIQDYDKAIEINSNDAKAYYNRGNAKDKLEDFGGAIKDYTKAIELNPNDVAAYINRGNAKGKLFDYSGAIQDYNNALEINPNLFEAYNNRAISKDNIEDYQGAIQDYTKAMELNPNDAKAYYNRGITKGKLYNYSAAIQDYTKAIEINPQYSAAYLSRGVAKYILFDLRGVFKGGSMPDLNKAIEINPNFADAYSMRGMAKDNLKDYRGAIQDYTKAIELDSNDANTYSLRGYAKQKLGDKNGACLDWSKAGELGDEKAYDSIKENCNE